MARKLYTVEVDEKNLASSVSSKASKVAANSAQKEVEAFGIVEINNNSAKNKVKNKKDAGFEKNVISGTKKAIKSNLAKIDDYFDFSFRPVAKVETVVEEVKAETKKKTCAKKVETKATVSKKTVKTAEKVAKTAKTKKADVAIEKVEEGSTKTITLKEETLSERQIMDEAKACDRFVFDDEAKRIISVARVGSLFDCDIKSIN